MVCRFAHDPVSKEVSSVVCLLCSTSCGHNSDDTLDHKRKMASNDKYYTGPGAPILLLASFASNMQQCGRTIKS
jgi:hypothetical protein